MNRINLLSSDGILLGVLELQEGQAGQYVGKLMEDQLPVGLRLLLNELEDAANNQLLARVEEIDQLIGRMGLMLRFGDHLINVKTLFINRANDVSLSFQSRDNNSDNP